MGTLDCNVKYKNAERIETNIWVWVNKKPSLWVCSLNYVHERGAYTSSFDSEFRSFKGGGEEDVIAFLVHLLWFIHKSSECTAISVRCIFQLYMVLFWFILS